MEKVNEKKKMEEEKEEKKKGEEREEKKVASPTENPGSATGGKLYKDVEQIKAGIKMVANSCTFLPKVSEKRDKKGDQIVQYHTMWGHFMTRNSNMVSDDRRWSRRRRRPWLT